MRSQKNGLGVVIGGIVLLVIVGAAIYYMKMTPAALTPTDEGSEIQTGLRVGENAIYVADQLPGSTVNVSLVDFASAGYVVIHETDANDNPTAVIGASSLLQAGEHKDIVIDTARPLVEGKIYIAMLHSDNGNGVYDNEVLDGAVIENGGPVWMFFSIDAEASEPGVTSL